MVQKCVASFAAQAVCPHTDVVYDPHQCAADMEKWAVFIMARQITPLLLSGCFYYGSSVHQCAAIITSSSDYAFSMMIMHCYQ